MVSAGEGGRTERPGRGLELGDIMNATTHPTPPARYGYDNDDSDVAEYTITAECVHCHAPTITDREACWLDTRGQLVTDCMCGEL